MAELGNAHTRASWGTILELFGRGQFHAFRVGDELLAVGGFVPIGEGVAEMSFNAAPAARRQLLGIIALGRLTIEAAPYRAIVAYGGTKAGAAFLRRLGFAPIGQSEHGEVWCHGRSVDGQGGVGLPQGAAGPGGGIAAPEPGDAGGAAG